MLASKNILPPDNMMGWPEPAWSEKTAIGESPISKEV
jgi:hypothetical protein